MFANLLAAIENSGLGQAARSLTWLYPAANVGHVLGVALLVGGIAVFDVLVLVRRYGEAVAAARAAIPLAALGIVILAATGPVLFAAEAAAIGFNPVFQVKMVLLVLGFLNLCVYYFFRRREDRKRGALSAAAPFHAIISLTVWIGVLFAGRATAYF